jgi:Flp pilus assembly protein TadD
LCLGALLLSGCASTGGARAPDPAAAVMSPEMSLAAGDAAARKGDFERALVYYVEAVSAEETPDGWLRVGAACTRLGQTERALTAYLKVIELDPEQVDAHEEAGLAYLSRGDAEAARAHLSRALALDARRWRAENALGILDDQAEDHASAIAHYQAALELNPASPMLRNNLGFSKYLTGNLEGAEADFRIATTLDADYKPAWSNLALVYADRGSYSQAVSLLAKVSEKPTAYNDVGYMALQRGDLLEAERLLSEAVRLSPAYYKTAYENLEAVRSRMRGEREATAVVAPTN